MFADITADGECKRAVDACVAAWGSIDILVNCAGICINIEDVTEFTRKEWDKMVAVNLTAAFEMTHEACKHMIKQGRGKIINIGSLFSFLGGQWSPAYAATKHGIVGLTKSMCDELAQFDIQVNAIAPGYFATKLTEKTRSDPAAQRHDPCRIFPPTAGAGRPTSWAPASSWPATRPTTSMAPS